MLISQTIAVDAVVMWATWNLATYYSNYHFFIFSFWSITNHTLILSRFHAWSPLRWTKPLMLPEQGAALPKLPITRCIELIALEVWSWKCWEEKKVDALLCCTHASTPPIPICSIHLEIFALGFGGCLQFHELEEELSDGSRSETSRRGGSRGPSKGSSLLRLWKWLFCQQGSEMYSHPATDTCLKPLSSHRL